MKKTLILLLVGLNLNAGGQHRTVDSLVNQLAKVRADTQRVNILNGISARLGSDKPTESLKYGKEALNLSVRVKWKKGIADAYNNLGNAYCNQANFPEAIENLENALDIRKEIGDKEGVAKALSNLGVVFIYQGKYKTALDYNFMSIKIRYEIADKTGIAKSYNNIGAIYIYQGKYADAVKMYDSAIVIMRELDDKEGIASTYHNIGAVYEQQGIYPEALRNYYAALKIDEEINNVRGVATHYSSIGIVHQNRDEYDAALKNQFMALKLLEQIGARNYIVATLTNIGNVYYAQGEFPEALNYIHKSLSLSIEINDSLTLASTYNLLGNIHNGMDQFDEALENYYISRSISSKMDDTIAITSVTGNIGQVYCKKRQYKLAEKFSLMSLSLANRINSTEWIKSANETLSDVYEKTGRTDLAFRHYKAYIAAKDLLKNEDSTKRIVQLRLQYEFEKKQAWKEAENDKRMALATAANKSRMNTMGLMGGSVFLISFISFYYYRKREDDKLHRELIEVRQQALNAQMSDHFIGNTMTSIRSFIEKNEKERAGEYLVLFSRLIRKVLENSAETLVALDDDMHVLNGYLELEKLRFAPGALQVIMDIDSEIETASTFVPPMVLQVLAENAIQHAFKPDTGGCITFRIHKEPRNMLVVEVEDNGVGRKKSATGADRKSYGTILAEKLVKSVARGGKGTTFDIIDLYDSDRRGSGTRVVAKFPLKTNA